MPCYFCIASENTFKGRMDFLSSFRTVRVLVPDTKELIKLVLFSAGSSENDAQGAALSLSGAFAFSVGQRDLWGVKGRAFLQRVLAKLEGMSIGTVQSLCKDASAALIFVQGLAKANFAWKLKEGEGERLGLQEKSGGNVLDEEHEEGEEARKDDAPTMHMVSSMIAEGVRKGVHVVVNGANYSGKSALIQSATTELGLDIVHFSPSSYSIKNAMQVTAKLKARRRDVEVLYHVDGSHGKSAAGIELVVTRLQGGPLCNDQKRAAVVIESCDLSRYSPSFLVAGARLVSVPVCTVTWEHAVERWLQEIGKTM